MSIYIKINLKISRIKYRNKIRNLQNILLVIVSGNTAMVTIKFINVRKIMKTLIFVRNFLNRANMIKSEKLENKLNINIRIQKQAIIFNL